MTRIHQLPPSVITKIAAGEVIERPASVLKELLENSIDAGSTRIDVEVEQGGTDLIRVVDNGYGIHPDDMGLAFASHATSKLKDADDLFKVGTLGFRGEALASIGGVARVTLQSRPYDRPRGSEVICHGGDLTGPRAWNGAAGTRIEVRHLFYNTPVRRKFLRTVTTEMGHLSETFTRIALAHPGLYLTLRHNGKPVYEAPTTDNLRDRIGLFFGKEVEEQLYPVHAERDGVKFWGWVADPAVERGNARLQYLFLNGRWIRDRSLGHALQEAFRGLLMTGRYAVAFLYLEMPPDLVDVNVHPTKAEVRFRDVQFLYSMVLSNIRRRLSDENLTSRLNVTSTLNTPRVQNNLQQTDPWLLPQRPASSALPPPPVFPSPPAPSVGPAPWERPMASPPSEPLPLPATPESLDSAFRSATTANSSQSVPTTPELPRSEDFKAIQLYNAYLVLETPEGMLVIDQHALHERILFEQLKRRLRQGTLETQQLLIPEPVELTPEQAALALEHHVALSGLGLEIEDFGGGTLVVRGYPAILGNRSPQDILKAVVDYLVAKERAPTREVLLNDLLSLMACHAAVRAGDPLTPEQIAALIAQRDLADDAHHCPHGRPTALLFSRHDLDRQFGRV
jgi:DNA mismatch repair protein MutL